MQQIYRSQCSNMFKYGLNDNKGGQGCINNTLRIQIDFWEKLKWTKYRLGLKSEIGLIDSLYIGEYFFIQLIVDFLSGISYDPKSGIENWLTKSDYCRSSLVLC